MLYSHAVFNISCYSKLTGKGGIETNYFSVIIGIICMTLPVFLVWILKQAFKDDIVYLIMALIGIAFIVTNNFWIRNIYKRMMKRRYANLEGFRQSR